MKTLVLLLAILLMPMVSAQDKIDKKKVRYAAIGDSYSIGEGASPNESWSALLTRHLNKKGIHVDILSPIHLAPVGRRSRPSTVSYRSSSNQSLTSPPCRSA